MKKSVLALAAVFVVLVLAGCTTTSYKQEKSPCACDFVMIEA